MTAKPVRVLLDNGIIGAAELAEIAKQEKTLNWGGTSTTLELTGYKKKKPAADAPTQLEVDAIVTISRLIREGVIAAYSYTELRFESLRGNSPIRAFHSLKGCDILDCLDPIVRSKFRQTENLFEHISKGGKKDKKRNNDVGDHGQILFFEWLLHLDENDIQTILNHVHLTQFEKDSFQQLDRFKFICNSLNSPENYPDAFHLWTAERNNMDYFLTLEKTLPNSAANMAQSKKQEHQSQVTVLRPSSLLNLLGVANLDESPIEPDRFYNLLQG